MVQSIDQMPKLDNVLSMSDMQGKRGGDVMARFEKQLTMSQYYTTDAEQRMSDIYHRYAQQLMNNFFHPQTRNQKQRTWVCFTLQLASAALRVQNPLLGDGMGAVAGLARDIFDGQSKNLEALQSSLNHQLQMADRCRAAQETATKNLDSARSRLLEARQAAQA